jgi:hypothetical protein
MYIGVSDSSDELGVAGMLFVLHGVVSQCYGADPMLLTPPDIATRIQRWSQLTAVVEVPIISRLSLAMTSLL